MGIHVPSLDGEHFEAISISATYRENGNTLVEGHQLPPRIASKPRAIGSLFDLSRLYGI